MVVVGGVYCKTEFPLSDNSYCTVLIICYGSGNRLVPSAPVNYTVDQLSSLLITKHTYSHGLVI